MTMRPYTTSAGLKASRAPQSGMTLIELLAAMAILGVLSTMLIMGWVNLQRASAFSVQENHARATARDALSRAASEIRDAQPSALPTASPTAVAAGAVLTDAQPMSATFLSVYNLPHAGDDLTGVGARRLTRIRLDTGGSTPQKTLWWERDSNNNGSFGDSTDRKIILARNVVNSSVPSTGSPTAVFSYGYRPNASSPIEWTDNLDSSLDLTKIWAVRVRLIIDANLKRAPRAIDVVTTVLPRNAVPYQQEEP
jgi:prepilin-type N-terminal cleavage/methylation domain-containing protein